MMTTTNLPSDLPSDLCDALVMAILAHEGGHEDASREYARAAGGMACDHDYTPEVVYAMVQGPWPGNVWCALVDGYYDALEMYDGGGY